MNKIGFQNFRRFSYFSPLGFREITFLVGRNNAGKSTLVKALLLVQEYLTSHGLKTFSFGNSVLEDANIVTYDRAKNKNAKENFIKFNYQLGNYTVEIKVSGEDGKTYADVHSLSILDIKDNIEFYFEPQVSQITINKWLDSDDNNEGKEPVNVISKLNQEIEILKLAVEKSDLKKSSKEYIELVDKLKSIQKKRNDLVHPKSDESLSFDGSNDKDEYLSFDGNNDKEDDLNPVAEPQFKDNAPEPFSISTFYVEGMSLAEIVDYIIKEATFIHDQEFVKIQKGETQSLFFENYRCFMLEKFNIDATFRNFIDTLFPRSYQYLGANPSKQTALFSIRDKNNALAQAINKFYQLGIKPGEKEYLFVLKWMKEFEVGESFSIVLHAGEAYEVEINSNGSIIHLADKGMGSIQAMLLIFRLASIIHNWQNGFITVIIEEPELNLHPALQSKLADLFLEVHDKYKINFIVETHSEYIIRKSQVLVAKGELAVSPNVSPFCVYYFPGDNNQEPYQLEYKEDGTFSGNFGDGFFDAASGSTLELIKLKRKNKE